MKWGFQTLSKTKSYFFPIGQGKVLIILTYIRPTKLECLHLLFELNRPNSQNLYIRN